MGGASNALAKIGFSETSLQISLGFFVFGVVGAGVSVASYQNDLVERAGYAAARVGGPALRQMISIGGYKLCGSNTIT